MKISNNRIVNVDFTCTSPRYKYVRFTCKKVGSGVCLPETNDILEFGNSVQMETSTQLFLRILEADYLFY